MKKKKYLLTAVPELASSDLGALGVQHDGAGMAGGLGRGPHVLDHAGVVLVASVGEVETRDGHAVTQQLRQDLDVVRGRPHRTHDLRADVHWVEGLFLPLLQRVMQGSLDALTRRHGLVLGLGRARDGRVQHLVLFFFSLGICACSGRGDERKEEKGQRTNTSVVLLLGASRVHLFPGGITVLLG